MSRNGQQIRRTPSGPLGNVRQFQHDPLHFFTELSQCGSGEVVPFSLLWLRCYLVTHPDGIQHILTRGAENYSRVTTDSEIFKQALGQSLLTTEGSSWLSTRRLMQPVFLRQHISSFGETITDAVQAMLGRWKQWQSSTDEEQTLDMVEEMRHLTLTIVAKALFSIDVTTVALGQQIDALAIVIDKMFHSPTILLPSLGLPLPPNLRLRAVLRQLDQELYRIIEAHMAEVRSEGGQYRDLLTLLIQARDEQDNRLSRQELRNELLDLLLAGQETTASMLMWSLLLLAQHPTVETRLREELAEVLAGRTPTVEDLPKLPFLALIIQESLRLYPPAWMITRIALKDDETCGYHIPKRSMVFFSPWVTQRHPRWWQDPEQFLPERFAPGNATYPRFAYFPFGLGPHRCIGEHLALQEAKLVLATVAQHYRLRLVVDHPVSPGVFPALRPVAGLPMSMHPM